MTMAQLSFVANSNEGTLHDDVCIQCNLADRGMPLVPLPREIDAPESMPRIEI